MNAPHTFRAGARHASPATPGAGRSSRVGCVARTWRAPGRSGVRVRAAEPTKLVCVTEGGCGANVSEIEISEPIIVGTDGSCELQVQADGVAPQHARLEMKAKRLMCTALTSDGTPTDPDALLPDTGPSAVRLNGSEIRAGVAYMVAPGARVSFGTEGAPEWEARFEEGGGAGGMADMMMRGMASAASAEVRETLDKQL
ncbi:unnamed protein product [Pedinophyceae sp. YPF-701]|nr:unnamed protein product [Pedinophyceae sp. YPF-701]